MIDFIAQALVALTGHIAESFALAWRWITEPTPLTIWTCLLTTVVLLCLAVEYSALRAYRSLISQPAHHQRHHGDRAHPACALCVTEP